MLTDQGRSDGAQTLKREELSGVRSAGPAGDSGTECSEVHGNKADHSLKAYLRYLLTLGHITAVSSKFLVYLKLLVF